MKSIKLHLTHLEISQSSLPQQWPSSTYQNNFGHKNCYLGWKISGKIYGISMLIWFEPITVYNFPFSSPGMDIHLLFRHTFLTIRFCNQISIKTKQKHNLLLLLRKEGTKIPQKKENLICIFLSLKAYP